MHELVSRAAGGTALLLQGRGTQRDATGADTVVHEAIGLLTYDSAKRQWLWVGVSGRGATTVDTPTVGDGRIEWGYVMDGGARMRYTITFVGGTSWVERGDLVLPDGRTTQVFEMRLKPRR